MMAKPLIIASVSENLSLSESSLAIQNSVHFHILLSLAFCLQNFFIELRRFTESKFANVNITTMLAIYKHRSENCVLLD
ncbi:hypothetical protein [Anabaena catenula]|uniref:hypothetical protein n=1 Tax=Anabaena catenula TaxID=1296320 RepID=UPI00168482EE|nr:hypothetical protein [Anabaena catenula]